MPASARPVVCSKTKRFILAFDERELSFSEDYPKDLTAILSVSELDGVIRRINDEFRVKVAKAAQRMRVWCITSILLALVAVGFLGIPQSLYTIVRFRTEMHRFWRRVRQFFVEINRQVYQSRRVEWRLTEDRKKLNSREVTFPLLAYVIEITIKPNILTQTYMTSQNILEPANLCPKTSDSLSLHGGQSQKDVNFEDSMITKTDCTDLDLRLMGTSLSAFDQETKESANFQDNILSKSISLPKSEAVISIAKRREIESIVLIENLSDLVGETNPLSGNGRQNINNSRTDSSFTDLTTTSDECRKMM